MIDRDDPFGTPVSQPHELRAGHKGLFFDRLDGGMVNATTGADTPRLVPGARLSGYARNRTLHTTLGRWNQPDLNAMGLAVQRSLSYHGVGIHASVQRFDLAAHFTDGPNVYVYLDNSPWTRSDPTGLFFGIVGSAMSAGFNAWDSASATLETAAIGLRSGFGLASMVSDYMTWQEEDLQWAADWTRRDVDYYSGGQAGEAFGVSFGGEKASSDSASPALAGLHRNSTRSRAHNLGYRIDYFNPKTQQWEVWKYGISATGTNSRGMSKRAMYQVNALNSNPGHKAHGKEFRVAEDLRHFNSRRQALAWERDMVRVNGRPPGMRRPRRRRRRREVGPGSKYWVGISRAEISKDDRRDRCLFAAESKIAQALSRSRVLHGTEWRGMTFMLMYCPERSPPNPYKLVVSRRHKLFHFHVDASDPVLLKVSDEQYIADVVASFLWMIADGLRREGLDTTRLDRMVRRVRGAPDGGTAFLNLRGPRNGPLAGDMEDEGPQIELSVPLKSRAGPTESEVRWLQGLDRIVAKALRAAGAGKLVGREVGQGTAEFIIDCSAEPMRAIKALRALYMNGEIPGAAAAFMLNHSTGSRRRVTLRGGRKR